MTSDRNYSFDERNLLLAMYCIAIMADVIMTTAISSSAPPARLRRSAADERLRFQETHRLPGFFEDGDAIVMKKDL